MDTLAGGLKPKGGVRVEDRETEDGEEEGRTGGDHPGASDEGWHEVVVSDGCYTEAGRAGEGGGAGGGGEGKRDGQWAGMGGAGGTKAREWRLVIESGYTVPSPHPGWGAGRDASWEEGEAGGAAGGGSIEGTDGRGGIKRARTGDEVPRLSEVLPSLLLQVEIEIFEAEVDADELQLLHIAHNLQQTLEQATELRRFRTRKEAAPATTPVGNCADYCGSGGKRVDSQKVCVSGTSRWSRCAGLGP
ncbi:unnamed protein product [Discosporangium mesarthrocarpum]